MMAARLRPQADEPQTRLKQVSLFTPTRVAVLDAVTARPGASLTDIARIIGRHVSTIDTNARLLVQAGLVRTERDGRRIRLYAVGALSERELFLARLGPSAAVYDAIVNGVPGRPVPLAHACRITRHAAQHHLDRLARLGAIRAIETRVLVTQRAYRPTKEQ